MGGPASTDGKAENTPIEIKIKALDNKKHLEIILITHNQIMILKPL